MLNKVVRGEATFDRVLSPTIDMAKGVEGGRSRNIQDR